MKSSREHKLVNQVNACEYDKWQPWGKSIRGSSKNIIPQTLTISEACLKLRHALHLHLLFRKSMEVLPVRSLEQHQGLHSDFHVSSGRGRRHTDYAVSSLSNSCFPYIILQIRQGFRGWSNKA